MDDELKKKIGIPEENQVVETKSDWKARKGLDTDTYYYDEINQNGEVVNQYVVKDSTSMYPPFGRSVTWEKVAPKNA